MTLPKSEPYICYRERSTNGLEGHIRTKTCKKDPASGEVFIGDDLVSKPKRNTRSERNTRLRKEKLTAKTNEEEEDKEEVALPASKGGDFS